MRWKKRAMRAWHFVCQRILEETTQKQAENAALAAHKMQAEQIMKGSLGWQLRGGPVPTARRR